MYRILWEDEIPGEDIGVVQVTVESSCLIQFFYLLDQ